MGSSIYDLNPYVRERYDSKIQQKAKPTKDNVNLPAHTPRSLMLPIKTCFPLKCVCVQFSIVKVEWLIWIFANEFFCEPRYRKESEEDHLHFLPTLALARARANTRTHCRFVLFGWNITFVTRLSRIHLISTFVKFMSDWTKETRKPKFWGSFCPHKTCVWTTKYEIFYVCFTSICMKYRFIGEMKTCISKTVPFPLKL